MADAAISLRLSVLPEHGPIEQALDGVINDWTKNRCTKGVTARTKWWFAGGCFLCLVGAVGTITYPSYPNSGSWLLLVSWQSLSLGLAVILHNLLARLRFVGPMQTKCLSATIRDLQSVLHLLIVVSNGAPLILFWMTVLNMLLWITSETALNIRILWFTLLLSVAMSVKRLSTKLCILKWVYQFDARELVKVMRKLLIIRKVGESTDKRNLSEQDTVICQALLEEEQQKVEEFLLSDPQCKDASIRVLVLFQTALLLFQNEHLPNKAHDIYKHLHSLQGRDDETEDSVNMFESILIERVEEGREIVKLFWPRPDGRVLKKDFIETIDDIDKEYQLLKQLIAWSSRIGHYFERMVNILFYIVVLFTILGLFSSLAWVKFFAAVSIGSPIVVAIVGICINHNKSFISFLRGRNYRIGDLIEVNLRESDLGVHTGRVKKIKMGETQLLALNGNKHTHANELMVNCSLQNLSRLQAKCYISVKVSVDTSGGLLVGKFRQAIVQYAKDNPREWLPIIPSAKAKECENDVKEYCFVIL